MGRTTKMTGDVEIKLMQAIKLGATHSMACAYAGISLTTFYAWKSKNTQFSDAVKEAEATGAITWLAKIEKAASDGSWQAAAWKLERRYPNDYGRRDGSKTDQEPHEAAQNAEQVRSDVLARISRLMGPENGSGKDQA